MEGKQMPAATFPSLSLCLVALAPQLGKEILARCWKKNKTIKREVV